MSGAGRGWVCLMYHDITERPEPGARGSRYFGVSRAAFAGQLALLADRGWTGCTMEAAAAGAAAGQVALTFDDGDQGQQTFGVAELVRRGMTATFFVTTGWVGTPGYISWNGLREMRAAGMSIQSHSHSHPFFSQLAAAAVREELHRSRTELDQQLGQVTASLALPGGDPPLPALRGLIAETGYRLVATSRWGVNRDAGAGERWINRCTIRGEIGGRPFARIAAGDPLVALRRQVREAALRTLRSTLGARRYAAWRSRFLDATLGGPAA